MNQSKSHPHSKFLSFSLIICGVIGFIYVFTFSPIILNLFSPDGELSELTIKNIQYSRKCVFLTSLVISIIGFLFEKYKYFQNLDLNFISFLIGLTFSIWSLFIVEISLRVIPFDTTKEIHKMSLSYEPSSFSIHKFSFNQDVYDRNGEIISKIRSGYRSLNNISLNNSNLIRAFILGGSFVYDTGAKLGESWPELTESLMSTEVDIINAGVPGHRTFDSIGKLISEIHLYKPKFVLLCNAWNDIKYFSELQPPYNTLFRLYPGLNHYTHDKSYSFIIDILEKSQIFLYLNALVAGKLNNSGFEGKFDVAKKGIITKYALNQYQLNLESFVDICKNMGSIPILMTQPRLVVKNNTDLDKKRIEYGYTGLNHNTLVDAFHKCDSIIFEVAKSKNVKVLDLAANLSGKSEFFIDHVHTTQLGSEVIASETAKFLKDMIFNLKNN